MFNSKIENRIRVFNSKVLRRKFDKSIPKQNIENHISYIIFRNDKNTYRGRLADSNKTKTIVKTFLLLK